MKALFEYIPREELVRVMETKALNFYGRVYVSRPSGRHFF